MEDRIEEVNRALCACGRSAHYASRHIGGSLACTVDSDLQHGRARLNRWDLSSSLAPQASPSRDDADFAVTAMVSAITHTPASSGSVDARCIAATHALAATPSSMDRELQLRNAAERGDVAAIDALVDAGVDPNASNYAGNTALHYAAWRGRAGAIAALLAAGAAPHARNSYGATPLHIAVREGHREAAEVLGYSST